MVLQTKYGGSGRRGDDLPDISIGVFGAFLLAVVGGLVTTLLWAPELRRVAAAPGWPTVQGRSVASSVYPRRRNSPYADVVADIEYIVNWQKFEHFGTEIASGVPIGEANRVKPSRGQAITVWYDPASPERSTLTATWTDGHALRMWVIVGCWGIAVLLTPVLVWRFYKATQGELVMDD